MGGRRSSLVRDLATAVRSGYIASCLMGLVVQDEGVHSVGVEEAVGPPLVLAFTAVLPSRLRVGLGGSVSGIATVQLINVNKGKDDEND